MTYIFVLEGDDHEVREYEAENEAEAREMCADGFNDQYSCDCANDDHGEDCDAADYDGSEFDIKGVYIGDINDSDNWAKVKAWPTGE